MCIKKGVCVWGCAGVGVGVCMCLFIIEMLVSSNSQQLPAVLTDAILHHMKCKYHECK